MIYEVRKIEYKPKAGVSFYILLVLQVLTTVTLVLLAIFMGSALFTWIVAILAAFFTGIFFLYFFLALKDTRYIIADTYLFIKTGLYELELPFDRIVSISHGVRSMLMQPALSFTRVEIKYKTLQGMTDIVHISPVNEDEFIKLLESKVDSINSGANTD